MPRPVPRRAAAPPEAPSSPNRWWLRVVGVVLSCPACSSVGYLYLRSESPYEAAVERATADQRVQNLLGAPVSADFFFTGSMNFKDGDSASVIQVGLEGSPQRGTLMVNGVRTSGLWGFNVLRVDAENGKRVTLTREF